MKKIIPIGEVRGHGVPERPLSVAVRGALAAGTKRREKLPNPSRANAPKAETLHPKDYANSNGKHFQDTRRFLAHAIESGTVDHTLIDALLFEDGFVPVEGTLIDYKRDVPADRLAVAKLLKHIQAFHNTYGGYLVLGAEEAKKDTAILPFHMTITPIEPKRLKDLCREFFSSPIEVIAQVLDITYAGSKWQVQVVHIPKRSNAEPVSFRKDGPGDDKSGKPVFEREQVCFRDGDNSLVANSNLHWRFVFGLRPNPYLAADPASAPISPVENNLPDRSFICQEFIGREEVIGELYRWLSDDFSCVRVLAGEGGLGKTSIAFEFASEVTRWHLGGVDAVIWATAKRQQFRALENSYEPLSNTHFGNSRELFEELARQLGATNEEVGETVDQHIPKFLKGLVQSVRVFAVVDDLDSLEINEQKRCIEVCQQLAGEGSRFLFTTRKNATASSSTAIELQGLGESDYTALITSWQIRLKLPAFAPKIIGRLRDASQGSPLYTESLLRLIKSGIQPNDAIAKWKGNLGVEVRNAALKREVLQLGPEARKVLVAAAIFGECSFAEIKQATDFSDPTLVDSFNELQTLFLLSTPAIAGQQRFGMSNTTRELVYSLGPELVAGFLAFESTTKANRYKSKGARTDLVAVGAAINQAMALISGKNPDQALKTVDEINAKFGGKNHDLLFMRARAYLHFDPPKIDNARKAFKQAFDLGQRKLRFFELWFKTELEAGHCETAIEVATDAIELGIGNHADWMRNRAHCRISSAGIQTKNGDLAGC